MKVSVTAGHFFEGFRYLIMSGMSALLSLGVPLVLHEGFAIRPDIAVAIGLASAFIMNFIVAKLFVFRRKGPVKREVARFTLVSLAFRSSEYLAFLLLHAVFEIQYMIANATVLFISFCVKFFVYKLFVFSHREKQLQAA